MRLIDAEALRKEIDKIYGYYDGYDHRDLDRFAERVDNLIDIAPTIRERPRGKWEYLKEHITEMRNADGKLNQKKTCQFILNLMRVIEEEGDEE